MPIYTESGQEIDPNLVRTLFSMNPPGPRNVPYTPTQEQLALLNQQNIAAPIPAPPPAPFVQPPQTPLSGPAPEPIPQMYDQWLGGGPVMDPTAMLQQQIEELLVGIIPGQGNLAAGLSAGDPTAIEQATTIQPLQGLTSMINPFFQGGQGQPIPAAPRRPRFLDPQPPLPSTAGGPVVI